MYRIKLQFPMRLCAVGNDRSVGRFDHRKLGRPSR